MNSMSIERPERIDDERSNVIEGPWQRQGTKPEEVHGEDAENPRENGEAPEAKGERSNVIEGPWPNREAEPEETPGEVGLEERATEIERVRQELMELSEKSDKKEPEPREPGKEGEETERHYFAEGFKQYKPCEACGGKGRRWFLFPCPACKGLGRVIASSSRKEGYHEAPKKDSGE